MKTELEVLEIRRTYSASRSKVYGALTTAKLMARWLNAGPDGHSVVESDCRIGGAYSVKMYSEGGELLAETSGEYLELELDRKVVCTWCTKGFVEHSVLSFELSDQEGGTELILRHQLPGALVDPHSQGWPNCLNRLDALVGGVS